MEMSGAAGDGRCREDRPSGELVSTMGDRRHLCGRRAGERAERGFEQVTVGATRKIYKDRNIQRR